MHKATYFKFLRNIHRVDRNKSPWKNVGNSSRGRSQGVMNIFRAPYRAHCAVIFATAQLSCILPAQLPSLYVHVYPVAHWQSAWVNCARCRATTCKRISSLWRRHVVESSVMTLLLNQRIILVKTAFSIAFTLTDSWPSSKTLDDQLLAAECCASAKSVSSGVPWSILSFPLLISRTLFSLGAFPFPVSHSHRRCYLKLLPQTSYLPRGV